MVAKTKVPGIDAEEKKFKNLCKLYFCSISGRAANYAYFNFFPNGVILCNSTSPKPNKIYGDRVVSFMISDLFMHFVTFKDTNFYEKIKQLFGITTDELIYFNICKFFNLITPVPLTNVRIERDKIDDLYFVNKKGGKNSWINVGAIEHDCHMRIMLKYWVEYVKCITSPTFFTENPSIILEGLPGNNEYKRVYLENIDTNLFKHQDGTPVFPQEMNLIRPICADGVNSVSFIYFIKKFPTDSFKYRRYYWTENDYCIKGMTTFENEMVTVVSILPNMHAMPLSKKFPVTHNNLLNQLGAEDVGISEQLYGTESEESED